MAEFIHDSITFASGEVFEDVVDDDPRIVGRRCVLLEEWEGCGEERATIGGFLMDGPHTMLAVTVDTGGPDNLDDPDGLREVLPEYIRLIPDGETQTCPDICRKGCAFIPCRKGYAP